MKFRFVVVAFVLLALVVLTSETSFAQCALCKANAETSVQSGNNTAKGLNAGIMYLLIIPYVIVAALGYWWFKRVYKAEEE